jgi:uncharacterized protein YPO0396
VDTLHVTPHAMTEQGLMSGKADRFDKQDQKRIDQDWMTGFDNRDRLAQLQQQMAQGEQNWRSLDAHKRNTLDAQASMQEQRRSWTALLAVQADELDVSSAQAKLVRVQSQLRELLNPQSDTAQAKAHWDSAQAATRAQEAASRALHIRHAQEQVVLDNANKQLTAYVNRMAQAAVVDADFLAQLSNWAKPLATLDGDTLEPQERETMQVLQARLQEALKKRADLHKDIVRQMGKALEQNRGVLDEHAQDVEELPHFLQRLTVLEEEALPEKRKRFQEYLNQTSQQGVDALLNGIAVQVDDIKERIDTLNDTLRRVDFQPGRYLQLEPREVIHQSLQALQKAQAVLRSERLRDDGGQSHFKALRTLIDMLQEHAGNRRNKASLALLDARHRLQFAVLVMDRESGQLVERRTGSQGGSGGEKEIISSYVLTASLSYALCPKGEARPVFGSIVLDEAFSKSSQAVAARIIQALREFGLHALFVTPNKEVRLLRNHTRSAVVVHRRRDGQASMVSLSWQELLQAREGVQRAAEGAA